MSESVATDVFEMDADRKSIGEVSQPETTRVKLGTCGGVLVGLLNLGQTPPFDPRQSFQLLHISLSDFRTYRAFTTYDCKYPTKDTHKTIIRYRPSTAHITSKSTEKRAQSLDIERRCETLAQRVAMFV